MSDQWQDRITTADGDYIGVEEVGCALEMERARRTEIERDWDAVERLIGGGPSRVEVIRDIMERSGKRQLRIASLEADLAAAKREATETITRLQSDNGVMTAALSENAERIAGLERDKERLEYSIRLAHNYVCDYNNDDSNVTHAKRVLLNAVVAIDAARENTARHTNATPCRR